MQLLNLLGIKLPRRHNTRRRRLTACQRFFNQQDARDLASPPHWSADENEVRCAAHLADHIDLGGTLKGYSAWSGCSVRELGKLLHAYRQRRLAGQRQLVEAA